MDNGDYVVVINANQVHLTGNKVTQKKYYWHTGWPGGLKTTNYESMLQNNPVNVSLSMFWIPFDSFVVSLFEEQCMECFLGIDIENALWND